MGAVAFVTGVLVAYNLIGNLWLPGPLYVPVNLAVAASLVAVALAAGATAADLGLSRASLPAGLVTGGLAALVVALAIGLAALVPATRPLFADRRVAGLDGAGLAYQALVRIPLGTVVLEELAFRGVLLALITRVASVGAAIACSSALFGLWHVVPTLEALHVNRLATTGGARVAAVSAAVALTAAAGGVFCWLRLHSGSVLAPALAHVATNSFAIVVAFVVLGGIQAAGVTR